MDETLNILLLEDSPLDAELTLGKLAEANLKFSATRVETESEFRRALEDRRYGLILSDFSLPSFTGLSALYIAAERRPELPFIFVSGAFGEETAVEMLKKGATDYVLKQRLERLVPAVTRAISEARERAERKRAEEALHWERQHAEEQREALLASERAARAEAERASRMKDEFLATLGHELRTPLNAIVGWSQVLRSRSGTPADLEEGLAVIERNARAQARIIEDLLDMSRIISGKVRLEARRINLCEIISAAVETVRPAAEQKQIRIAVEQAPMPVTVMGDPGRLQQVFWNLLSNAIKFTPAHGSVRVTVVTDQTRVQVAVRDTGLGIRPEFLPHVFDRFRQADASTTRTHGGLGLGLSIVKQLIDMHGGQVQAQSNGVGEGSTFTVTLPVSTHGIDGMRHGLSHDGAAIDGTAIDGTAIDGTGIDGEANGFGSDGAERSKLAGVRVLIVDDEPDVRQLVRRILTECDAD
ncbi:MAG: ATP-binding protein, partial [Tepidisphaeraceae bacterium]